MIYPTGTNSSLLITQSKLVNKTRNETLNDFFAPAVANDSELLKKGDVSFSQLKEQRPKLMNSGDAFSNFCNAELKVDEIFTTDKRIARKNKNSYSEAVRYDNTLIC